MLGEGRRGGAPVPAGRLGPGLRAGPGAGGSGGNCLQLALGREGLSRVTNPQEGAGLKSRSLTRAVRGWPQWGKELLARGVAKSESCVG